MATMKGNSAATLMVLCLLSMVLFGYYLEGDSIPRPSSLLSNHALVSQVIPRSSANSSRAPDAEFLIRAGTESKVVGESEAFGESWALPEEEGEHAEDADTTDTEVQLDYEDSDGDESSDNSVDSEAESSPVDQKQKVVESSPMGTKQNIPPRETLRYQPPDRHKLPKEMNVIFKHLPPQDSRWANIRGPPDVRPQSKLPHGPKVPSQFKRPDAQTRAILDKRREASLMDRKRRDYIRHARLETQGPRNWRKLPAKLYQLAPVIFDTVPRTFLPEFRNPCWYSNEQLLCLPYFYILGFPKAGTTDLWDKVNSHPQVMRTIKKETHFWRDRRIGIGAVFQAYLSNALLLTHRLKAGDADVVSGDGSATTVISNYRFLPFFPNTTTEMYTNVDIIKELTPKAKMLIAVREPVERLYSGYLYHPLDHRRSVQDFDREANHYIKTFRQCQTQHSELRCTFIKNKTEGRSGRLKTGMYAPFIKTWVDGFGFDQVKIVRLEDWRDDCPRVLSEIFEHLELTPLESSVTTHLCIRRTANQSRKHIGPMLNRTRDMLGKFYEPYNKRLSELLDTTVYPPYS